MRLGSALVAHAVLAVLVVILEGERHAGDVSTLHQFQRVIGIVGAWQITATADFVLAQFQFKCAFTVATATKHVGNHVGVVQVQDHIGTADKFLSDATRLQYFIDFAGVTPRCEVHASHTEDDWSALDGATLRLSFLWLTNL